MTRNLSLVATVRPINLTPIIMNPCSILIIGLGAVFGPIILITFVIGRMDKRAAQKRTSDEAANPNAWSKVVKRMSPGTMFEYMGVKMTVTTVLSEIDVSEECWEPGELVAEYRDGNGVIRQQSFAMRQAPVLMAAPICASA